MRISDWSSDVCSSDLRSGEGALPGAHGCEHEDVERARQAGQCAREDEGLQLHAGGGHRQRAGCLLVVARADHDAPGPGPGIDRISTAARPTIPRTNRYRTHWLSMSQRFQSTGGTVVSGTRLEKLTGLRRYEWSATAKAMVVTAR